MTGIQPELWVDRASAAVEFYEAAFSATVVHRVGQGDDIVAQLAVGDAAFWVTAASPAMHRLSPLSIGGATGRTLLVVDDPHSALRQAIDAGARRLPRSPTNMAGGWVGSSTRSDMSGRSAGRSATGRRPEDRTPTACPPFERAARHAQTRRP
jgi:PhnB protein